MYSFPSHISIHHCHSSILPSDSDSSSRMASSAGSSGTNRSSASIGYYRVLTYYASPKSHTHLDSPCEIFPKLQLQLKAGMHMYESYPILPSHWIVRLLIHFFSMQLKRISRQSLFHIALDESMDYG